MNRTGEAIMTPAKDSAIEEAFGHKTTLTRSGRKVKRPLHLSPSERSQQQTSANNTSRNTKDAVDKHDACTPGKPSSASFEPVADATDLPHVPKKRITSVTTAADSTKTQHDVSNSEEAGVTKSGRKLKLPSKLMDYESELLSTPRKGSIGNNTRGSHAGQVAKTPRSSKKSTVEITPQLNKDSEQRPSNLAKRTKSVVANDEIHLSSPQYSASNENAEHSKIQSRKTRSAVSPKVKLTDSEMNMERMLEHNDASTPVKTPNPKKQQRARKTVVEENAMRLEISVSTAEDVPLSRSGRKLKPKKMFGEDVGKTPTKQVTKIHDSEHGTEDSGPESKISSKTRIKQAKKGELSNIKDETSASETQEKHGTNNLTDKTGKPKTIAREILKVNATVEMSQEQQGGQQEKLSIENSELVGQAAIAPVKKRSQEKEALTRPSRQMNPEKEFGFKDKNTATASITVAQFDSLRTGFITHRNVDDHHHPKQTKLIDELLEDATSPSIDTAKSPVVRNIPHMQIHEDGTCSDDSPKEKKNNPSEKITRPSLTRKLARKDQHITETDIVNENSILQPEGIDVVEDIVTEIFIGNESCHETGNESVEREDPSKLKKNAPFEEKSSILSHTSNSEQRSSKFAKRTKSVVANDEIYLSSPQYSAANENAEHSKIQSRRTRSAVPPKVKLADSEINMERMLEHNDTSTPVNTPKPKKQQTTRKTVVEESAVPLEISVSTAEDVPLSRSGRKLKPKKMFGEDVGKTPTKQITKIYDSEHGTLLESKISSKKTIKQAKKGELPNIKDETSATETQEKHGTHNLTDKTGNQKPTAREIQKDNATIEKSQEQQTGQQEKLSIENSELMEQAANAPVKKRSQEKETLTRPSRQMNPEKEFGFKDKNTATASITVAQFDSLRIGFITHRNGDDHHHPKQTKLIDELLEDATSPSIDIAKSPVVRNVPLIQIHEDGTCSDDSPKEKKNNLSEKTTRPSLTLELVEKDQHTTETDIVSESFILQPTRKFSKNSTTELRYEDQRISSVFPTLITRDIKQQEPIVDGSNKLGQSYIDDIEYLEQEIENIMEHVQTVPPSDTTHETTDDLHRIEEKINEIPKIVISETPASPVHSVNLQLNETFSPIKTSLPCELVAGIPQIPAINQAATQDVTGRSLESIQNLDPKSRESSLDKTPEIIEIMDSPASIAFSKHMQATGSASSTPVVLNTMLHRTQIMNYDQRKKRSLSTSAADAKKRNVTFHSPANSTAMLDDIDKRLKQKGMQTVGKTGTIEAVIGKPTPRKRSLSEHKGTKYEEGAKPSKISKLPNFKNIHANYFNRMESIADFMKRKEKRAQVIMTAASPGSKLLSQDSAPSSTLMKAHHSKEIKQSTQQKVYVFKSGSRGKDKAGEGTSNIASSSEPAANFSSAERLFNRNKVTKNMINRDQKQTNNRQMHYKSVKIPSKQNTKTANTNSDGVTSSVPTSTASTVRPVDRLREKQSQMLKGVRFNRRFELQMKHRDNLQQH